VDLSSVDPAVVAAYHLDRLPLDRPTRSTSDLLRLDGKVALVTGGGGAGLGNAICHRLAEQGATLAIVDANHDAAATAAKEIRDTWQVQAIAVTGNVADWDAAHRSVQTAVGELGGIDILVNNAGGSGAIGAGGDRLRPRGSFAEMSRQDMETTVGVNLMGVLHMTKATLEVMIAKRAGRIINISSEGGKRGAPGLSVYGSCKAAVIGLTRNLAHELGPEGITVVAVCPATMISDRLLSGGHLTPELDGLMGWSFRQTSIGRFSVADEVASMVAFLAAPAGSYVHGSAVSVAGGFAS
jgi:3-oxoacyl-[acyl-carrier protein] reductase